MYNVRVYSGKNSVGGLTASSALKLQPVDLKLQAFTRLPGARSASSRTVGRAAQWLSFMREAGISDIDVFPGNDGEVLVSGISDDICFEVTVEIDGSLSVSLEHDDEQVYHRTRQSELEVRRQLEEVASEIWTLSGGFMRTNSMPASHVSQVSHSKNLPVQMAACPWLIQTVAKEKAAL